MTTRDRSNSDSHYSLQHLPASLPVTNSLPWRLRYAENGKHKMRRFSTQEAALAFISPHREERDPETYYDLEHRPDVPKDATPETARYIAALPWEAVWIEHGTRRTKRFASEALGVAYFEGDPA